MRVYLDACSLQRPLDDRSQPRVNLEAEAVLTILRLVESGELEMVSSDALEFEVARTPDAQRRAAGKDILKLAGQTLRLGEQVEAEAAALIQAPRRASPRIRIGGRGRILLHVRRQAAEESRAAQVVDDDRRHAA